MRLRTDVETMQDLTTSLAELLMANVQLTEQLAAVDAQLADAERQVRYLRQRCDWQAARPSSHRRMVLKLR